MKAAEPKAAASPAKKNSPFFSKDSEQSFFGSKGNENSFFSKPKSFIQTKLTIGQPNDVYEKEADATADKVVQRLSENKVQTRPENNKHFFNQNRNGTIQQKPIAPISSITPIVQTKCSTCENEEKLQKKEEVEEKDLLRDKLQEKPIFEGIVKPPDDENDIQRKCAECDIEDKLQKKSDTGLQIASADIEKSLNATKGSGSLLPLETRGQMESSFGVDFSNVRIHDDSSSVQMNKDLNAHAFTNGNDIYFNEGKYDTNSSNGKHLLAHELTHTIQQGASVQKKPNLDDSLTADLVSPGSNQSGYIQRNFFGDAADWVINTGSKAMSAVRDGSEWMGGRVRDGAAWVRDKAVEGVEWIFNQIKDLINGGVEWLTGKFNGIREFALSSFDVIKTTLGDLANRITSPMNLMTNAFENMDAAALRRVWNMLSAGAKAVWQTIKTVIDGLLATGEGIWNTISEYITTLFGTVGSLINSTAFGLLPDFLSENARSLFNYINNLWLTIRNFWNDFWERLNLFINNLLDSIQSFIQKIISTAISEVISYVENLREVYLFVEKIVTDPVAVIQPIIDQIAGKIESETPAQAREVAHEKMNEAYLNRNAAPSSVSGIIQRQHHHTIERSTASRDEVNDSLNKALSEQWAVVKSKGIGGLVWETIKNMFWPPDTIKAIGKEFYDLWKMDWTNAAHSLFTPRNIFDDFGGFFHDIWSNVRILLDFPLALLRRLVNTLMLLMGYVTIILVIVGFFFAGVGAGAGLALSFLIGEFLFASFLVIESASALKAFLDLYTARQTQDEKDQDYLQIAASAIGCGIAIVIALIFFALGRLASKIVTLIKQGKAPITRPAATTVGNIPPVGTEPPRAQQPGTQLPLTEPPADVPPGPQSPSTEPPRNEPPRVEPNTPIDQLSNKGRNIPPLTRPELARVLRWQNFRNRFLVRWRRLNFSSFDEFLNSKLSKARNSIEKNLTPDDLAGTIKELRGEQILDNNNVPFDHIGENNGARTSIKKAIEALKNEIRLNPSNIEFESMLRDLSTLLDEVNSTINGT